MCRISNSNTCFPLSPIYLIPADQLVPVLRNLWFSPPGIAYSPWPVALKPDGYTFFSVSQERIMDEIDEEAKRARLQGPKTGANWGEKAASLSLDSLFCPALTPGEDSWYHWVIFHAWLLLFFLLFQTGLFVLMIGIKGWLFWFVLSSFELLFSGTD